MSYNTKNYTEQGGEKTVIGGEIVVEGKLTVADGGQVAGITGATAAATASTIGGIKADTKGESDTVEVKIDTASSKLYVPTYPTTATTSTAGLVKQAANVPEVDGALTADDFNALLDALITAGIMAAAE